jgi:hypothetical protein
MKNLKDTKIIKRRVCISLDNRIEPRRMDYATMTIYPDGYIGFKQRGKDEMVVSVAAIYRQALCRSISVSMGAPKLIKKVSRGLLSTKDIRLRS